MVEEPVVATEVESRLLLEQIVFDDDGFLGLHSTQLSEEPSLFRSSDGVEWTDFASMANPELAAPIQWRRFIESSDGLAIAVRQPDFDFDSDVYVSSQGETWESLADFSRFGNSESTLQPIAVHGESVIAIDQVSAVEVAQPASTEDTVIDSAVNCDAEPDDLRTSTIELRFLGPEPSEVSSGSFFSFAGTTSPAFFYLDGLRVGVIDRGGAELKLCDDGRLLPPRGPGVVVIDGETGENLRFPAPAALANELRRQRNAIVLGELQLVENRTHVIVAIGGVLWAIDEVTSEWRALTTPVNDIGFTTTSDAVWSASGSSGRFYAVADGLVTIVEVGVGFDGEFEATARNSVIFHESEEAGTRTGLRLGAGSILHANDKLIFYSQGGTTVWRLELPIRELFSSDACMTCCRREGCR